MNNFELFGPRKQIILKKLKLSSNFVDFKKTIISEGYYFNKERFFAMSIEGILQQETSDFLEGATSATSYGQILQWETYNETFSTCNFCNE